MSDPIVVAMIVAIPPTLGALLAYFQSRKNTKALDEVHITLNSRLTQLLEQTGKAARAEGKAEGKKESE